MVYCSEKRGHPDIKGSAKLEHATNHRSHQR
jgi:hypothetical protein